MPWNPGPGATEGDDVFAGTSGSDVAVGLGGKDSLNGFASDDQLYGGADNDTLNGGSGNDLLDGGTGNDAMAGSLGNDRYYVDSVDDYIVESASQGTDTVYVSVNTYSLADNVENLFATGDSDFGSYNGNGLNNTIDGKQAFYVNGYGGDDRLLARGSEGSVDGGSGFDTFVATSSFSQFLQTLHDFEAMELYAGSPASVEFYEFSGAQVGSGLASNLVLKSVGSGPIELRFRLDEFFAGTAIDVSAFDLAAWGDRNRIRLDGFDTDDTLTGGSKTDWLSGGLGNDALDGGSGVDTAFYNDKVDTVSVALLGSVVRTVTVGGVAEDSVRRIENVVGGSAGDTLTGDGLANLFRGGGGADVLNGFGGLDTVDFSDKSAAVVLTLAGSAVATATVGGASEDQVKNIENIIGGSAGDTLKGDTLANALTGGLGGDQLAGGGAADTFVYTAVGDSTVAVAGRDKIVDFSQAQGDKIDLSAIDAVVGGADNAFVIGSVGVAGRLQVTTVVANSVYLVQGDVDGGGADFAIVVNASAAPVSGDFVL